MLAPFVLRRLKSDVLKQLVAKTEKLEKVPLSEVRWSDEKGDERFRLGCWTRLLVEIVTGDCCRAKLSDERRRRDCRMSVLDETVGRDCQMELFFRPDHRTKLLKDQTVRRRRDCQTWLSAETGEFNGQTILSEGVLVGWRRWRNEEETASLVRTPTPPNA